MNNFRHLALALLAAPLLGCGQAPAPPVPPAPPAAPTAATDSPQTMIGKAAQRAIEAAREELARSNINLNNEFQDGGSNVQVVAKTSGKNPDDPRANAELTPQGELLLDGRKVETTPAQQVLLVEYRREVMDLAEIGMALGVQGADLGGKAIREVFNGLLNGDPSQIDARIESEAGKLEADAKRLCMKLSTLRETQQQLATALPAFKPYATMTQADIDDCGKDGKDAARTEAERTRVRDEVRSQIRDSVRSAIGSGQPAVDHGVGATAATLIAAVKTQRIQEIRRQVEAGVDINARVRGDGTAMIRAAADGNLAIVDELIRLGADVNKSSRGDGNPLIAAAKAGHLDIVKRLVAAGAAIDAVVPGDETALINAARGGHLDVVTYLVERGANVNQGVFADYGRWRSPLNQANDASVRKYLQGKGARAGRDA